MKKIVALFLALAMVLSMSAALAGRTAPEDKKIITNNDFGAETFFKKYDNKFYDDASEEPGEIVKVEYTTTAYGEPLNSWVNVYVPYGYDASRQYNIIYFLHGTNEDQTSFVSDDRAKNALDNMIEVGVADPFIMVFPTYYYNYADRAIDIPAFKNELRNDIMPAVESQYSTYAETADDAGFAASREHRAIAGYSRGSYATWHMMNGLLDTAKWWLPMSAAISGEEEMTVGVMPAADQVAWLGAALDSQPNYDYFIILSTGGGRDMMYEEVTTLFSEMLKDAHFSYGNDPAVNNLFYNMSAEVHQTLIGRLYFYNAFDIMFK